MAPVAVSPSPTSTPAAALKPAAQPAEAFDIRSFAHFDNTPVLGTEFGPSRDGKPALDIQSVLGSDTRLRALGRLVSERGVVFIRNATITPEEQKVLVHKLGLLGGKPSTSGLHVHPTTPDDQPEGKEITIISNQSRVARALFGQDDIRQRRKGSAFWHSDVTFERAPSDYACLVLRTLPDVGGDTHWASVYEAYDRLSPALQGFLEGLTAVHSGARFAEYYRDIPGFKFPEPRGSPENVGQELTATHPVIRTNPVTGWKGLFVNTEFTKRIVELTEPESERLLKFLFEHVSANHDLQVRFRWEENSLAIWDNRSTFHAANQ